MSDLKDQVGSLTAKLDRVVLDRLSSGSGILPDPVAAAATSSAGNMAVSPDGRRVENSPRESRFGSVTTISHLLVKGTSPSPIPDLHPASVSRFPNSSGSASYPSTGRLPKLPFPKFDGELKTQSCGNRVWKAISRCMVSTRRIG